MPVVHGASACDICSEYKTSTACVFPKSSTVIGLHLRLQGKMVGDVGYCGGRGRWSTSVDDDADIGSFAVAVVMMINSDHVLVAISDRAGVRLDEDQADVRLGQQDEGIEPPEAREVSMPPDRFVTQVRSDTLKRMYVTRGLGKKYGPTLGCAGCATIGSRHQASHSDTCRDRMRAELERSEEGREYLARKQARVDARKQEQPSSSSHKRAVSEEWCRPPDTFWRMGEEEVTMRQDITATSGVSSSSESRGPAMDTESRPSRKRAADVQTEDFEDHEQLDANASAASFPQAEGESSDGRLFIGNWEHVESEKHNQCLGDKVAGDGYLGPDESMGITTVNEQGVQWDFTNVEESCGKTNLAHGSASVCQLEVEIERELDSHDRERKR